MIKTLLSLTVLAMAVLMTGRSAMAGDYSYGSKDYSKNYGNNYKHDQSYMNSDYQTSQYSKYDYQDKKETNNYSNYSDNYKQDNYSQSGNYDHQNYGQQSSDNHMQMMDMQKLWYWLQMILMHFMHMGSMS